MASVLSSLIELIDICKNRLPDINISPADMVFKKSAENCNLSLQPGECFLGEEKGDERAVVNKKAWLFMDWIIPKKEK